MLKLIAEDFIQVDKIELVLPLYQELIEKTRFEQGCLAYDLYHDLKDLGHFVFIEEWVDRQALNFHTQSEHFQRLVPQIDQYQRQAAKFTHMQSFESVFSEHIQDFPIIQIAQSSDFMTLLELWERSVRDSHNFLSEQDIIDLKPLILNQYLPNLTVFKLIQHDKIRGFIAVDQNKLEMLFVDHDAQKQGYGTQLLHYATQQLAVQQVDVNEQNPTAIRFYLKHNFTITARSALDGQGKPYPLLHLSLNK